MYRPMRTFLLLGGTVFALGVGLGLRFLWFWSAGRGGGKVQSLILAAALLVIGVQFVITALLADVVAANRKLMEETLLRVRRIESALPLAWQDGPAMRLNEAKAAPEAERAAPRSGPASR
jgi:hypothetical protein